MGLFEILTAFALVGRNFKMNIFKFIAIDDGFDRVNRSFMFFISLLFAVIVMFQHWMFDTIHCLHFTSFLQAFAEDYCWAQGMYTIKEAYNVQDQKIPYPGIIPEDIPKCFPHQLIDGGRIACPEPEDEKPFTRLYLPWYPMVIFYFWVAAALFFFPFRVLKKLGLRDVKDAIVILQNRPQFADDLPFFIERAATWLQLKLEVYIQHRHEILGIMRRHHLFIVIMCIKFTYLFISIGLMSFTNSMLQTGHLDNVNYMNYGVHWLSDRASNRTQYANVKDMLFPKIVACEVKRWGATGETSQ